ncbi:MULTISPECIES: hypothetical protein [Paenibacillus]|jgi:hypothetical protein|uniref:hypothetical protein n=1 Tax=Paenibacillus TaxID=44249 RepID=UPI0001AFD65C|nr:MULTISPECIES: hypothetical protein [unclassified Paenibacillus]EES71702.1 hypothetical protein POTG_03692 [Paenibacillus sp. oral taxon 786 str. D14]
MFMHWFKKGKRQDSLVSRHKLVLPNESEWTKLKLMWEKSRNEHSSLEQTLIQAEAEPFERVRGMLEEALSLLDDACVETDGMLKVRLQQIWGDLDELVKSYTME